MVHAASSLLLYDNDQAPRASVVTLATRAFGRAVAPALAGLEFGPIYVSTERGNGQGGASEQRGWYAQPSIDSLSPRHRRGGLPWPKRARTDSGVVKDGLPRL